MKEIEFRAKTLKTGEWVSGFFSKTLYKQSYIIEKRMCSIGYEVDIKTLCEFTGAFDRKNNKIYEHDIVKWRKGYLKGFGEIRYNALMGGFFIAGKDIYCPIIEVDDCKVVGNAFDNGELLKEKSPEPKATNKQLKKECVKNLRTMMKRNSVPKYPHPCENCGAKKVAPYYKDLNSPLSATWLCKKCYKKIGEKEHLI